MTFIARSAKRARLYERKFDHDEAARRHQAGERISDLAAEFGVTYMAVYQAVTPGAKERSVLAHKAWRTTTCETCGGPAMRLVAGKGMHNPDGRTICASCRSKERRTNVRFHHGTGELVAVKCSMTDCANGEQWQPPSSFPRGNRFPDLREGGFHSQCRACNTRARQAYRQRHKVPCRNCGAPCLPASEKGPRGRENGLCKNCWIDANLRGRTA